jgi:hypothetical protein
MANPSTRQGLIYYCLRQLGDPVIEINVDPDQLEDRVDEALQYFQDFHSDATLRTYLKHVVTQENIDNGYIPLSSNITYVTRLFPITDSTSSRNFFDIKYQLSLNDFWDLQTYVGDLAYYEQMQQYLSLIDMKLTGTPQVRFSRVQNRLYIDGDLDGEDIKVGDYVVAEVYEIVDGSSFSGVWNNRWLKEYTTAIIKRQWGQNLIKFEGMQLPGGVTLNGRQLYEDALSDIERLKEEMKMEHEFPADFFVG